MAKISTIITLFILFPLVTQGQPLIENLMAIKAVPNLDSGDLCWGDFNNDGYFDILMTGMSDDGPVTEVFLNDTEGSFFSCNAGLTPLSNSNVSVCDFNNDNVLDIFVSGLPESGSSTESQSLLYKNNGVAVFTLVEYTFQGVENGSSDWSDYDQDGDQDLLLTGNHGNLGHTIIYKNLGNGDFIESYPLLEQLKFGEAIWGDYDNDGDPDILLSGRHKNQSGYEQKTTAIYENINGDVFEKLNTDLYAMDSCNVSWADWDADGDLDIIANGSTNGPTHVVSLFQNQGNDVFLNSGAEIVGTIAGDVDWGDYDNDGDLDFLIHGQTSLNDEVICEIYRNVNFGLFAKDYEINLHPLRNSCSAWADYDRDGDLDLLISGQKPGEPQRRASLLYENKNIFTNTAPETPGNLSSQVLDNTVILSWEAATDEETPAANLSYNLQIGTQANQGDIMSGMSSSQNRKLISDYGNVFQNLQYTVGFLDPGTYFWKIQAVDNNFDVSDFSTEQIFTITTLNTTHQDFIHKKHISCSPNPCTSYTVFTLSEEMQTNKESLRLKVYNASGAVIDEFQLSTTHTFRFQNHPSWNHGSGVFYWQAQGMLNESGKIIKLE